MRYVVKVMPRAARQMADAVAWLAAHTPQTLDAFEAELDAVIYSLSRFPERGALLGGGRYTRRWLMIARTEHLIVYRVLPRARRVEILALWHARRGIRP